MLAWFHSWHAAKHINLLAICYKRGRLAPDSSNQYPTTATAVAVVADRLPTAVAQLQSSIQHHATFVDYYSVSVLDKPKAQVLACV
jgi:hypothetical protein